MIKDYKTFDIDYIYKTKLQKRKVGNPSSKTKAKYKDIICAFDIETTLIDDINQSVMYIWQFQIGLHETVIGRTWEEFLKLLSRISSALRDNEYLVVYVHNLSYEFSFLKGIYNFKPEEVFCIDSRKILKCTMFDHFEFRCSMFHTNMKLSEYTEKMDVEHKKLSGEEFDYTKKRFSWTPLNWNELQYCINDVLGLVEALYKDIKVEDDSLYTFPLTSTGYPRRDTKKAMKVKPHKYFEEINPDLNLMNLLQEAFRGGNTHGNRYYADCIVEDAGSVDFVSCYPAVIMLYRLPVSEFVEIKNCTFEMLKEMIITREKAVLMRVKLINGKLHNKYWGCPYLASNKCRDIIRGVYDNGRLLAFDYLETTITDVDLKIICDEYDIDDIIPLEVYTSRYGFLPEELRNVVYSYFEDKTKLKGVEGMENYYMKAKAKLNAIYGMMCQNPLKEHYRYENDEFKIDTDDFETVLAKFNKTNHLVYQWGVWVTSLARFKLEEAMKCIDPEQFVYCDTDSIKFVGESKFEKLNEELKALAELNGGVAYDPKGKAHYLGMLEDDGHYKRFRTMGAKKYAYEDYDGSVHVTCAGVDKEKGGKELEKYGGLEAFKEGFIFKEAGGTELTYNDIREPYEIEIDGHKQIITSNVVISDSTYTLGLANDYRRLLNDLKLMNRLLKLK